MEQYQYAKINKDKLNSSDYFRVQAQFKTRRDKILWAAKYGFLSECYPEIAERIRNDIAPKVIKKLNEHFEIVLKSNPQSKIRFEMWLMQNVIDADLHTEVKQTVFDKYE